MPHLRTCSAAFLLTFASGCARSPATPEPTIGTSPIPAIQAAEGTARPPFRFSAQDDVLLDEITRGAFNFLWKEVNATGMVPDRSSKPEVVSVAGLGFQISAFCIGVERGWVTRQAAYDRTLRIVKALAAQTSNRKDGMFYHFISGEDGGFPKNTPEDAVSTIDSALLFAGLLTASQYFGGEVKTISEAIVAEANWNAYVLQEQAPDYERGVIALAWAPEDPKNPTGPGKLKPYGWVDAGDEHRLVTFFAVAAPNPKHRVDPSMYYRLRRPLGTHNNVPMVYLPWSGAHFVNLFAHCWIDYAGMPADNPQAFNQANRARVDWWENGRRQTILHRDKAIVAAGKFPNLGPDSWGLTASDCPSGYCVPGVYPTPLRLPVERPQWDHPTFEPKDDFGDGTISPYGAVSSVVFEPALALSAARHMRGLKIPGPRPVWDDPAKGGFGFADAYNAPKGWVAEDHLAIDQGPMAVLIENARTGLLWRIFSAHPWVSAGSERLGWPSVKDRLKAR
ncbi:MAG: hypothetical protein HEQ23_16010 [Tepidisphaera sp.]